MYEFIRGNRVRVGVNWHVHAVFLCTQTLVICIHTSGHFVLR